jgi:lysophospholipid acyltransferase (LPLAT)-like uncharacterized protein
MKDGFWYRFSLGVVPGFFLWLSVLLFATCRIRVHGQEYWDQIEARQKPAIGSFWHYSIFFSMFFMRKKSGVAMVSASRDGEFVNRIVRKMGYETVRGSRTKGGVQAIKGLIRHIREGRNGAIVADGSQGPARIVQAGCIVLASRTSAPVLPMLWSCSRYKRFGSWDGTAVPLPFSKIDFFYGEPLHVPPKIKSEEVEKYRMILENRLNDLYTEAWALQGKTEH